MSRRASLFASVAGASIAAGVAACSLIVSTSDLSGGAPPDAAEDTSTTAPPDANGANDAAMDAGDAADARDPDLVAELSFEDADGTVARDSSGNGNDAVLMGGASFVADGQRGRAAALHGADFVLATALDGPRFPRSGTLSLWFRYSFPPGDSTTDRGIFDGYDTARHHLFVRRSKGAAAGFMQVAFQPGTPTYAFVESFPATQGVWTHVVVSWDEATNIGAVYVGGALLLQQEAAAPFVPTGQSFRLGQGFIGAIDEVRLYKRALLPEQAMKLE